MNTMVDSLTSGSDSPVRPKAKTAILPVEFGHLSNDVQRTLSKLEGRLVELEHDIRLYRVGTFLAFALLAERLWSLLL